MSAPILLLTLLQRPVFLLNSRSGQFTAPPDLSRRDPFSLSYGANLLSSLTRDNSITFSDFGVPTSGGLRYGRSGVNENGDFLANSGTGVALGLPAASAPMGKPHWSDAPCPIGTLRSLYWVPSFSSPERYGNTNPLSIAYAFRPRLRPD